MKTADKTKKRKELTDYMYACKECQRIIHDIIWRNTFPLADKTE